MGFCSERQPMNLSGHVTALTQNFSSTGFQPPGSEPDANPEDGFAAKSAQPDPRELRILLIEDSRPIKERLANLLTVPGQMRIAGSAATEKEAIEQIDAAEFDVLIVDVELREGSGIGAIRRGREHYPAARQPLIIVLTNYPLPAVRSHCFRAGADHFLDKMRQFQDVKALINAAPRLSGA